MSEQKLITAFADIELPASKSESNRLLIMEALSGEDWGISNLSEADDTAVLRHILGAKEGDLHDVGAAGTTMRFLTAYFTLRAGNHFLTGSQRMKERPIGILVDALRGLGGQITYAERDQYPPLRIRGGAIRGGAITIRGDVSSQYLSALLMIGPYLPGGLQLILQGELTSEPYLRMTIACMKKAGARVKMDKNVIKVARSPYRKIAWTVESDWSAASYLYSMVALADKAEITTRNLRSDSLQADAVLPEIYKNFGVSTQIVQTETGTLVTLSKKAAHKLPTSFEYDFTHCPDIAQTVAVTCAGLKVSARLSGLKTLRIKETDRIAALKHELSKFGVGVIVQGDDAIEILPAESFTSDVVIETYHDHRMAMSFAPLSLRVPLSIQNPEVVSKSFPRFWQEMAKAGIVPGESD